MVKEYDKKLKPKEFVKKGQQIKMKELWDNISDELWEKE